MNTITVTLPLPLTAEQSVAIAALLNLEVGVPDVAPAKRGRPKKLEVEAPAAAAPVAPGAPAEPQMTTEDFQAVLQRVVKQLGGPAVKEVFAQFKAKKFSDIKPADYAKVAQSLEAAMAGGDAAEDLTS